MGQDFNGAQQGTMRPELKETDYQSWTRISLDDAVHVVCRCRRDDCHGRRHPRRIDVPVEVPEGVSRAGIFGEEAEQRSYAPQARLLNFAKMSASASQVTKQPLSSGRAKPKRERVAGIGSGTGASSGAVIGQAPPPPSPTPGLMSAAVSDGLTSSTKLSPEDEKRQLLSAKLHPSILAVIERLKKREGKPGTDEQKFIRNGKAEVQVWLTEKSSETLAKLKELGFEVVLDPKTAKLVIGRMPIESLEKLADLKFVRYVAPQNIP